MLSFWNNLNISHENSKAGYMCKMRNEELELVLSRICARSTPAAWKLPLAFHLPQIKNARSYLHSILCPSGAQCTTTRTWSVKCHLTANDATFFLNKTVISCSKLCDLTAWTGDLALMNVPILFITFILSKILHIRRTTTRWHFNDKLLHLSTSLLDMWRKYYCKTVCMHVRVWL